MKAKVIVCFGAALLAVAVAADESSWLQPRTTRRYLHPPMADCMYTFWNDGKIMRGENRHRHDWKIGFSEKGVGADLAKPLIL